MINRVLAAAVNTPCRVLHRMWWIPGWNRSALLTCPIAWACAHSERFDRWYFEAAK